LVDRIRIESAAGPKPILIVQIRKGLDRSVDFNERVTAFTTGTACTPSSDIKGRIRPMLQKKQDSQTPLPVAAAICGGHKMTAAIDHPWSPIY